MTLTIPHDIVNQAGLDEHETLIEFACRMFDAEKLELWPAAKLAGLSRVEMEDELSKRGIAIYRPTLEDLTEDIAAIEKLRKKRS